MAADGVTPPDFNLPSIAPHKILDIEFLKACSTATMLHHALVLNGAAPARAHRQRTANMPMRTRNGSCAHRVASRRKRRGCSGLPMCRVQA